MNSSISVIIPTYNRRNFLPRAIRSALAQMQAGDELIVVDDGSTDGTREVVLEFGDAIRYHECANGGAGRARNVGLDLAVGDYVAFLDSDDEWFSGKLDMQRNLLDARPELLYVFSDFAITWKEGGEARRFLVNWLEESVSWSEAFGPATPYSQITELPSGVEDFSVHIGDTSSIQIESPVVLTSSLLVRRCEAGEALRFAEDLPILEDWYCFARLAMRGMGAYLDLETAWQHGAAPHRVSSAGIFERAVAWAKVNERVWARDPGFRQRNESRYRRAVLRNDAQLAHALLMRGCSGQARRILADNPFASTADRLLSRLPDTMMRAAVAMRNWLRAA